MVRKSNSNVDEYPQYLNAEVNETVANTYAEQAIATPVVRNTPDGGAYVMNILKIIVEIYDPSAVNVQNVYQAWHLSKKTASAIGELNDPNIIWVDRRSLEVFDSAATDATMAIFRDWRTRVIDLTDGNGHGYLYAGQNLYLATKGTQQTAVGYARIKIMYTLVKANPTELLQMLAE